MNYIKMGIGMSTKSKRKKTKGITTVILIITMIILSFAFYKTNIPLVNTISYKIVSFVTGTGKMIGGVFTKGFDYFEGVKDIKTENAKLLEENTKLKYSLVEIPLIKEEIEALKIKLGIKENYNHLDLAYADVLLRDYGNWNETFEINKGSKQGLKEKQTVISSKGLVGYISKVGENTSTVKTILDPSTAVSIEIASINKVALVKGDFQLKKAGNLKLVYIPIDTDISIAETVYTSGIGGLYPKGIPVGTIIKVVNRKNEIDRYAVVKPLHNIYDIKSVAIIK